MFTSDKHNLLSLFAAMIAADKHVYAVEIDVFTVSVVQFFKTTDILPVPSQAQLLMWFELNRDDIRAKLTEDNFQTWFEALIGEVAQIYSIKSVLGVMQEIAEADGEVHISEKALLVLVNRYWLRAA